MEQSIADIPSPHPSENNASSLVLSDDSATGTIENISKQNYLSPGSRGAVQKKLGCS